jgi:hypothetical protein
MPLMRSLRRPFPPCSACAVPMARSPMGARSLRAQAAAGAATDSGACSTVLATDTALWTQLQRAACISRPTRRCGLSFNGRHASRDRHGAVDSASTGGMHLATDTALWTQLQRAACNLSRDRHGAVDSASTGCMQPHGAALASGATGATGGATGVATAEGALHGVQRQPPGRLGSAHLRNP